MKVSEVKLSKREFLHVSQIMARLQVSKVAVCGTLKYFTQNLRDQADPK